MSFQVPFSGFEFHQHQQEAITWMADRERTAEYVRGGILGHEMGLGKTWIVIGHLLNSEPEARDTLILVPPSLQPQWSEALRKSGIPHRILGSARGEDGPWRDVLPEGEVKTPRVWLATYDRATNSIGLFEGMRFHRIVCDEGHVFRNGAKTKRFRALSSIVAPRRWIMTGTPVQNYAQDYQNLLRFLDMPEELRLATPARRVAEVVMLRRTVAEVRGAVAAMPTQKPLHVVHPVSYPEGGQEQLVFDALVGKFLLAIESHAANFIILELYLRIRQFIAHPSLYVEAMKRKFKEGYARESWTDSASKLAQFKTFLATEAGQPTIVFTTFKGEMDHAKSALEEAGYATWSIAGGMTDAQRESVVSESRAAVEAGNQRVALLVNIVAGGAGLNLQHCARVAFLSSHWNPAIVDQAIARAYRMGQTRRVEVHHFMLADNAERNLDRYMARLHGAKRDIALSVHDKLFCDTAVEVRSMMEELDAVLPAVEAIGGDEDVVLEGDPVLLT